MKLSSTGALVPERGFTRFKVAGQPARLAAWRSHDGIIVVSSLERAYLPGSGDPPLVGPQWLVSVSRSTGGIDARCRTTDEDLARVVGCFDMPAFDEDNHHPGVARHLWCPVDPQYRQACECKLTETTVTDGHYRWTTDQDEECRGCWYQRVFGPACTIHATVTP